MKLQKLGEWLAIVTNIGVMAGLIFVAMEYRQNRALLEIESSANRSNQVNDIVNIVIQDPTLIELMGKDDDQLTQVESDRLRLLGIRMILAFEEQYEATMAGHGSTLERNRAIQSAIFSRSRMNYGTPHAWPTFRARGETPFVQWFERNVVSRVPSSHE